MLQEDYLRWDGPILLGEQTEKRFLGAGWRRLFAVFDSAPLYEVFHGEAQVGTLDAGFVEGLEVPFNFILAGRPWTATSVDPKSRAVRAKPTRNAEPPRWDSYGGLDVPPETARRGRRGYLGGAVAVPDLGFDAEAAVRQAIDDALPWRPGQIVVARRGASVLLRTFAGDKINRTLAKLLEAEGLIRVRANYRELRVDHAGNDLDQVVPMLEDVRRRLREAPAPATRVSQALALTVRRFPFSPFAQCLPDDLFVAALADERLDAEGAAALLEAATVEILVDDAAAP